MAIVEMDFEGKDDAAYKTLMGEMDMKPLTYEAVVKGWDSNPNKWYHALVAIEDSCWPFQILRPTPGVNASS